MSKKKSQQTVKGLTEEQQAMFDKLTTLQKGMVVHTLKGKKPAEAHKLAGGKCKEANRSKLGSEILNKPEVAEFLAIMRSEAATEAKVDASFILKGAKEVYDRCMQNVRPVTYKDGSIKRDEEGNPVYAFDAKSSIAALKLMGDHVNVMAFKQVTEHKHTFENMPDDELDAKIRKLMAAVNAN